jgi:NADH-quinone oxidoreductase subunit L
MPILDNLWIIPLLPLLGSATNGLFGAKWPNKIVSAVAVGSTGLSFATALEAVREFLQLPHEQIPWVQQYFTWIVAGNFRAGFDLQLDHLTVVMLMVVTGVGWLIHIYSIGYMGHEGGYYRFFSYLNLFMFFMLILVLAANYVLLFVGWEGVGLSSYLLIGFYFLRKSAADAGKKAFIVNRIGDFGFMLGMFLLFRTFSTLDFVPLFSKAAPLPADAFGHLGTFTVACLLLFMGACGKSAQLPLYVWLPDAMEGPTPVSALIHAATMVTAGVYVVARSHVLFTHAPTAMLVVAIVGCATALFAATIGLVQTDIKRVLAYSTVSQLGYMFLACGVGAFTAGIFHLMTHAFFKALLFLGAGSVIHGLSGEQDLRHMGGLKKYMPVTFWTLLVASLAISGFPGLSGFFSKDEILAATYHYSPLMYWIGTITAGMTAFYVFRAFFLAFFGKYRGHHHPHESPAVMTLPLIALAVLSVIGGYLSVPKWLEPMFPMEETGSVVLMVISSAAGIIGILIAYYMYVIKPAKAESTAMTAGPVYTLLANKYYVDEIYGAVITRPLEAFSRYVLWKGIDENVIDGGVNAGSRRIQGIGSLFRQFQSGSIRNYAAWVMAGSLLLLIVLGLSGGGK